MFKKYPKLDDKVALEMLGNILNTCGADEISVPMDTLTSYSQYRKNRYVLQKVIIIIMFIVFCIIPFMFLSPKLSTQVNTEGDHLHDPVVELEVDSPIVPVRKVLAYMGDQYIPVYETAPHVYNIRPGMNGLLHITVTLSNGQEQSADIEISGVDVETPHVISNYEENDRIHIMVTDGEDGSGINFDGVYSITSTGERVYPSDYDENENEIVYDFPEYPMNIYVPDIAGNILHLVLTLD